MGPLAALVPILKPIVGLVSGEAKSAGEPPDPENVAMAQTNLPGSPARQLGQAFGQPTIGTFGGRIPSQSAGLLNRELKTRFRR